ncbi:hypothetical protein B9Z55_020831 [Caenorhabditis nigoni]|uniref:F-box domain-containing protein n=1 Tax=Caenorhabditis nigoni TaxID=1611254 RepID=A0A2G5TPB8_9PELO|nr:hypothetical protein B9Z55_020831 [Caenorhabditis nigoni]
MPDVPMNLILGNVGPSAIFSLRKVCRSLRDFIDETIPELHLNAINIFLGNKKITIHLFHHLETLHISYMIQGNGYKTSVLVGNRDNRKEKLIENVHYMEGF